MSDQSMREYRDRWTAVAEFQRQEMRAKTSAQSWRELNAVLRMAMGLQLPLRGSNDGVEEVRQRWLTLKLKQKP